MMKPQRIMITAWGSRGDIQPITALAKELINQGREVLVFATPPATDLLENQGINYIAAQEDISDFVEEMFSKADLSDRSLSGFIKLAKFGKAFLSDPDYVATQTEDIKTAFAAAKAFKPDLLVTPNILYGYFVSMGEALQIPVVSYDLQINHPTSEYPLYTMQFGKFSPKLNKPLYWLKSKLYTKTIAPKFELARRLFNLAEKSYTDGSSFKIWPHDLPQICAVSPSLCPEPTDWPRQKRMGGWWFLEGASDYDPPVELAEFVKHKPVYAGFGSMKGNEDFCRTLSTLTIEGLFKANRKGILLGGWAGLTREAIDQSTEHGKALYEWSSENILEIDSCPHDWLFPHCSAVIHHGGAGTLAAGLRAGTPTVVCAAQGDQPFHGSLVAVRGFGEYLGMIGSSEVNSEAIALALERIIDNPEIKEACQQISDNVKQERGTQYAVEFIDEMYNDFDYPWSLAHKN